MLGYQLPDRLTTFPSGCLSLHPTGLAKHMFSWSKPSPLPQPSPEVLLYTRDGCHLCEDALAILLAVQQQFPFSLRILDIDQDPELVARHGLEIPVVCIDGQIRFRGRVDRVLLTRLLRARRS